MSPRKEILLNAFTMNCVGHINHGLWTHPRDRSSDYKRLDYWTDLAETLERGLFDAMFIADIVGVYDVYRDSIDLTARESIQLPVNDPTLLVPAMAAVTKNLGFGVTVNTAVEHPYTFARRFSTLDHLTEGRIGWNIVTGYLDSAARGVGKSAMAEHDTRYDRADDYLDLLYKLWETSWEDGAVLNDKAGRLYADPAKIHEIRHEGPFYQSRGYHLSEPSPQRTPVLFQAGTSGRGQRFAARHAECIFISASDPAAARNVSAELRAAAVAAGRRADDIRILVGLSVVTGETDALAEEKLQEYLTYANPEAGLAHFAAGSGIDFSTYGLDDEITYGPTNAIQSTTAVARQKRLTRRQLLEQLRLGGRYPLIVGSGDTVAAEMQRWIEEGEIDGFNLTRTVVPESWVDFIRFVVPALQERGIYKTEPRGGTLRRHIFGEGDRLPARHAGLQPLRLQTGSAA
ncbi:MULTISPECIES: LLM class flavin-dependent oxidoreductase [unclassified Aureimonas]|uniref:LLM class flavin-dependent oxidoreductase n=1 Tax=unclassified Aureimonas TaxID=2615206 RepID=UPI0006FD95CD|nr:MULTISPECIES: LLM class flavin-dependent oxidoreductase [unclassified Aureimonas]KQT52469.1 N5,N10-methylene tetrahydromethanopterin reductase [Aureimonas sp. Leaf427]KQT77630.1 N5,N10-methylene tetrahydromethanopterin reductase [Aureimonas sp. Leaf460]